MSEVPQLLVSDIVIGWPCDSELVPSAYQPLVSKVRMTFGAASPMWKILPRIDRNKVSGVLDEDGFPFEKVVGSQMLSLSVEEPIRVISDVEYMLSHALNKQARPSLGMIGFIKRPCQYEYVQGVVLSLNEKGRIAFQITPRIEGALGLTRKSLAYWVEAANLAAPFEGGLPGQEV